MKCKVFNLRLKGEGVRSDESDLNNFLEKVSRIYSAVINEKKQQFWSLLIFYEDKSTKTKHPSVQGEDITLTSLENSLYEALRVWRNDRATRENIPAYTIAHNLWLKQMVKMRVSTKEDLLRIRRAEKYGDDIIKLIRSFSLAEGNQRQVFNSL